MEHNNSTLYTNFRNSVNNHSNEKIISYLFFPSIFIFKILLFSTLTTLTICKLQKKQFFNPALTKVSNCAKIYNAIGVGMTAIFNYNIIFFTLSQFHLHNEDYELHCRINSIFKFMFLLEFVAYWYHRVSHEIQFIYKNTHMIHHRNIEVYPIDFLEFDYIDNVAQTLYINLPLYFVPMNVNDYAIIYYFYSTCAFLIHSDILTRDHIIHHNRFKYNYGLLFPVFDIIFGTYFY